MHSPLRLSRLCTFILLSSLVGSLSADERTEFFDVNPGWEAINNRPADGAGRAIRQDFGYSRTSHAGRGTGEVGGWITPAAEPAFYARPLAPLTIGEPLSASGTMAFTGGNTHFLIAFFNADTLKEWRTPNTIALRISVRGERFLAWLEYATSRWRAGADDPVSFPTEPNAETGRRDLVGFPTAGVHPWSIAYDPMGNGGNGAVTAEIDGVRSVCHLAPDHKADGAEFNRFGLLNVMKSADDPGHAWLGSVTINGTPEDFSIDPGWEGRSNRIEYQTRVVRPVFDFGFSVSRFAEGRRPGELGGIVFRGDCRYPDKLASYADRLDPLTLRKPIRASGRVSLRRGVSDSSALIGFFNAGESLKVNPAQDSGLPMSFLGISTDGPSREGFYFTPTYRLAGDARGQATERHARILPDGRPHDWSFEFSPDANQGNGQITVTLDSQRVDLPLALGHRSQPTSFNRFGLLTTWVDGNSQTIYFDDLTYTFRQD